MQTTSQIRAGLNGLVYALFEHAQKKASRSVGGVSDDFLGTVPIVDDPVEIDQLAKRPDQYIKNFSLVSAFGHSRFNTDGAEWAARRDLTQPNYLSAGKSARQTSIFETFDAELTHCGEEIEAIQNAVFAGSLRIFFGAFGLAPVVAPTRALLDRMRDVLRELQFLSWNSPDPQQQDRALRAGRDVLADFVDLFGDDAAARALMERFERQASTVRGFSAIEEFAMNLFAGIETTVAAASWFIDRIAMNPDVQARVHREIAEKGAAPYTDCLINETMRYFPPIPFVVREAAGDAELGKRRFRKGQLVLVSIVGAHHHPAYWHEPHVFDSGRAEFINDSFDRRAYIPFLTGPRMCGGARLGRLELKEAVRAIVTMFEFHRTDDIVRFDYGLALKPDTNSSIGVQRRTA